MFNKKGALLVAMETNAAKIDIVDVGDLITATEVESALQEIFGDYQAGGVARTLSGDLDLNNNSINNLLGIGAVPISADQWGYLGAMTKDPIGGDATAGRTLRGSRIQIKNGSNAATLKCTVDSRWNGESIAEVDNIAKGATTGGFTLNAGGDTLIIEAAGLTGNVVYAFCILQYNVSGTDLTIEAIAYINDIKLGAYNSKTGAVLDMTILVDTGQMNIDIFHINDE